MGMRVGGSSGTWNQNSIGQWQQRQQNVKDMFSAIKAGDLTGAQKAMAAIGGGSSNNDGPFAAISKALQNGDIQGAQQAAQAMHSHHHHAHATTTSAPAAAITASTTSASIALGLGQNVNTTA